MSAIYTSPPEYSSYSVFCIEAAQEEANKLRALDEGDALDYILAVKDEIGYWTPQIDLVGLHLLKPDTQWQTWEGLVGA